MAEAPEYRATSLNLKDGGRRRTARTTSRSEIMARVRGSDTIPELRVRGLLYSLGYRFRLHRRTLPGSPDIVLSKYRLAVFVHGCFWHQHAGCKKAALPKTNVDFWKKKLSRNSERDKDVRCKLESAGWQVLVIWECETKDENRLREMLTTKLERYRDASS